MVAGNMPETVAITGALIVLVFYLLVGGRAYCSWVCPVNIVTDTAHWARERLGISSASRLSATTRYWIMAMSLVLSAATGLLVWEWINPVSMAHRGLIFGAGLAWLVLLGVFLLDFLVSKRPGAASLSRGCFLQLAGGTQPVTGTRRLTRAM